MSSPSRKVGLRKRFSIAVQSAAAGATAGILTPVLFYRERVRAAADNSPKTPIDWNRFAQTIHSSGVLQMLMADLVDMRAGDDDEEVWEDDDPEDYEETSTVH